MHEQWRKINTFFRLQLITELFGPGAKEMSALQDLKYL